MIPSHKRLTWKDIAYMLRRGKKFYWKVRGLVVLDQYNHRSWHQASFQIPLKADKRATMRNMLKRSAQGAFWWQIEIHNRPYKKRFFFLHKQSLDTVKQLLASSSKKTILMTRKNICQKDFISLIQQWWTNSSKHFMRR